MADVLRKKYQTGMAMLLFAVFILIGGSFVSAAAANDIGPGVPGSWNISLTELKTVLDADGHQWKEMQTARDIRINVTYDMAGSRHLKYIFVEDMLTTVQGNNSGAAFSEADFTWLLDTWEAELFGNWGAAEIMVREMEKTEDMLNARQMVLSDGQRYVSISAYRHPNNQVLGNVMYFNPALPAGKKLWQYCSATGSGFVKK